MFLTINLVNKNENIDYQGIENKNLGIQSSSSCCLSTQ